MNTFGLAVLYFFASLSVLVITRSEHREEDDDKEYENLAEARKACCSSEEHKSICTPEKCYFLLNEEEKTWSVARTDCRKHYIDYFDFVDTASFSNDIEFLNVLKELKKLKYSKVWTSGTCCWEDVDLSHRWANGERYDLSSFIEPHNKDLEVLCRYMNLDINTGRLKYEDEMNKYHVLCELKVPEDDETNETIICNTTTTWSFNNTSQTETDDDVTESKTSETTDIFTVTESTTHKTTIITTDDNTEITIRGKLFCERKTIHGVDWPETKANNNVKNVCPEGTTGEAHWYCNKFGEWDTEEPIMNNCLSTWINDIKNEISSGGKDLLDIAERLANLSQNDMKLGDVNEMVKTIESLRTNLLSGSPGVLPDATIVRFGDAVLKTGSNMLNENQEKGWKYLSAENRIKTANRFMQNMETVGTMIVCGIHTEEESIVTKNIALQSFIFTDSSRVTFPKSRNVMNTSTFISLPKNLTDIEYSECGSSPSGYGIIYKKIAPYLTDDRRKWKINSKTIGFCFGDGTTSINLPEGKRVEITLEHLHPGLYNATCVFWNTVTLEWDGTDCTTLKSNRTHTVCACTHLTNFAVLMDISGHIEKEDNSIMTYLTYVCCSLSIISLIITIACLMGFRAVHSRRSTITCNLCYCLLTVNLIVIFGLERTEIRTICSIIAGLLHYVAIASFAWMLLEGYHLYQMVIVVFHKIDTVKFRWLYLFGYGSPLLLVVISASISPDSYGRSEFCWISYEDGFMWSFAGPVAVIILANTVVLTMALRSASNVKTKKDQSKIRSMLGWLKGSFSLMSLLGITWVFGFVYASKTTLSFAYVFIVFNGLQGVFLMIFHVVLNEKVRQCFRNIVARKKVSHHIFISSLRTTTSQNPLNSQSVQPSKTSYLSSRRSSVSPVNPVFASHI